MDPSMYEHMQSLAFIVFVGLLSPTPVEFAYFVPCRPLLCPTELLHHIEHKLALLQHTMKIPTVSGFDFRPCVPSTKFPDRSREASFLSEDTIIFLYFQRSCISVVPIKKKEDNKYSPVEFRIEIELFLRGKKSFFKLSIESWRRIEKFPGIIEFRRETD